MKKEKRITVAPFYAVALLWLGYALLFPLYQPVHYGLVTTMSIIVFVVVMLLCKSEAVIGAAPPSEQEPVKPKETPATPKERPDTGNPELDQAQKNIHMALSEMKRLDAAIEDLVISADIVRMEEASEAILKAVREDPKKLSQIRRFMDYYLPTALKLLNSYDRMSAAGVVGENIGTALSKVENTMHTIAAAFEKQLDSLYSSDVLDISADISVLEKMMASEGLTAKDQTDSGEIRLEL